MNSASRPTASLGVAAVTAALLATAAGLVAMAVADAAPLALFATAAPVTVGRPAGLIGAPVVTRGALPVMAAFSDRQSSLAPEGLPAESAPAAAPVGIAFGACVAAATAAVALLGLARRPPVAMAPLTGLRTEAGRYSTALAAGAAATSTPVQVGQFSILGSSRKQNEDRLDVGPAGPAQFLAVYDGHGGDSVSTWLKAEFRERLGRTFDPARAEKSLNRAFLAADKIVLQPARLMFGIPGERGIGGSKCGSTAVVALVYVLDGVRKLAVANVGDARCLLIKKDGSVQQLTIDHVPDNETERLRIESKNPNRKMPLVRFVGETWRVGGLLALSRAFGDAYLKSSGQFEGISFNNADYESGFGVIAEPDMKVVDLEPDDEYVLLSSDGLYANTERGGGGGFENPEVGPFIKKLAGKPLNDIAQALCKEAQKRGSTDDVTVVLGKL